MINDVMTSFGPMVASRDKLAEIRKASDSLQASFVKTIVKQMRSEASQEFKDMPGNDIYEDMIDTTLADKLSSQGHFGMSDNLFAQMSKLQLEQDAAERARTQQASLASGITKPVTPLVNPPRLAKPPLFGPIQNNFLPSSTINKK